MESFSFGPEADEGEEKVGVGHGEKEAVVAPRRRELKAPELKAVTLIFEVPEELVYFHAGAVPSDDSRERLVLHIRSKKPWFFLLYVKAGDNPNWVLHRFVVPNDSKVQLCAPGDLESTQRSPETFGFHPHLSLGSDHKLETKSLQML